MKSEMETDMGKYGYSAAVSVLFTIGPIDDDEADDMSLENAESAWGVEDVGKFTAVETDSEADEDSQQTIDFRALGLSEEHIPELIKLATDVHLFYDEDVLDDEFLAIIYAWQALAQLEAMEAAEPLLRMLRTLNDDEKGLDDWSTTELPDVLGVVGRDILPTMALELHSTDSPFFYRMALVDTIGALSLNYEELWQECVDTLVNELGMYRPTQRELNAYLALELAEMKAEEALGTIREAFTQNVIAVDLFGDFEDAEIIMGVRTERETPNKNWIDEEARLNPNSHYRAIGSGDEDEKPSETVVNTEPKIGRNDPCPCGSGKKYKKCCLKA